MASAEAQIQIAVKNLNALNKLDKQLSKINKTTEALLRGVEKLTVSVDNLSKTQGFDNLAKGANAAAKSVDEATKSISTLQKIQEVVGMKGRLNKFGLMGLGGIGATAAGIKGINNLSDAYNKLLGPLGNLLPAIKAPTIALGKFGVVGKAAAVLTSAKLAPALGVLAVAYMALGDKAIPAIKGTVQGTVQLGKGLFGLGKTVGTELQSSLIQGSLAFQPLRTEIELTTQALLKLDERFNAPGGVINRLSKGGQMPNRAFGMRQVGTPSEEAARRRNRRINEMAARHREDRLVTTAIAGPTSKRAGQEIKRLKSIDANMKKTAVESKKSNTILSSQSLFGPTAYQPPIPGLGPVTSGTGFTAAQYGPQQLPNTLRSGFQRQRNRLGIGRFANPQGMFASRKGAQGRIGGALTSGMIGGGFPLLFGQSPLASLFGGIGGAAGGALGGGLGFGLSIAGTAMAQRIQETIDFRKSIKDLNVDMKAMGFNAGFNAKEIIKLGKSLGITKQEAVQVAEQFKRFGKQGALFAQAFGGDFGAFTVVAQANEVESAMAAIKSINKELSLEEELRYSIALRTLGVEKTIDQLLKTQLEKQRQKVKESFAVGDPDGQKLRPGLRRRQTQTLNEEDDRIQKTIDGLQKIREAYKKVTLAAEANSRSIVKGLEDVNRELRKLNDPQYQIVEGAKAISGAFKESFKGIISGTMSVQQAFANMFQRIADHFLDMAAQMAATQLQKGILSMFSNAFSGSLAADRAFSGLGPGSALNTPANLPMPRGAEGAYWTGGLKAFARGGMVTRPTIGLVGEAGEDEYIIPASKMSGAMERYSAGARGQGVIPGSGTVASGSGVSSTPTVVNYTGPVLSFNSEAYVPKSAIPEIINSAARRGSEEGQSKVFSKLKNSRSQRSRVGL